MQLSTAGAKHRVRQRARFCMAKMTSVAKPRAKRGEQRARGGFPFPGQFGRTFTHNSYLARGDLMVIDANIVDYFYCVAIVGGTRGDRFIVTAAPDPRSLDDRHVRRLMGRGLGP